MGFFCNMDFYTDIRSYHLFTDNNLDAKMIISETLLTKHLAAIRSPKHDPEVLKLNNLW